MIASYPAYKSTAIPLLPEMPEHWELRRNKYLLKEINERSLHGDEDLLSVSQYTGVTLKKDRLESERDLLTTASTLEGYKIVRRDDLVVNIMLAWNGSLGVSNYDGIASPAYCVYRFGKNINPKYYHYLFRADFMKLYFRSVSSGVIESRLRMYTDDFYQLYSFLPPLPEQTAIANYLDAKTEKINRFIEKKEKLIALLKEQKQAVINELLVNGVYREVAKKSSGFEFFGDVPVHWNIMKLRFIGFCQNGMNKDGEYFRSGYPFISYGDVYKFEDIPTDLSGKAESTFDERITYSVIKGDVFFTRTSETIEEIGFASACTETIKDATFSGFLIRFRPRPNILLPEFSKFFFRSSLVRRFFIKEMNIMTRASLSQNLLKNLPVLIPPISEQKEIAICIQRESRKLERAISRIEKEIEKVKELKQSLIAEVVTGKIKVA